MRLVSVIIANYNYARFLGEAVESVVRQSYSPVELLIGDDGSSDGSGELAESLKRRYSDRFVRFEVRLFESNRGKLHVLNQLVPDIRGELTVVLDADDYLDADYLTRTAGKLCDLRDQRLDIGFVYTDCWLVCEDGDRLARGRSARFDVDLLQTRSYIPTCATTWTTVLRNGVPFDESVRVGTKHHVWRKVVSNGTMGHHIDQPLFSYRMHAHNVSGIGERILGSVAAAGARDCILSGHWFAESRVADAITL